MSPIFQVNTDEVSKSVIKRTAQLTEPLQVIPEDEELNLNLKSNTSKQLPALCKRLSKSKSEHPSPSPSHWHVSATHSPRAPVGCGCHSHSACPPSTVHLGPPSTTHVYAVGTLYCPLPRPAIRNEFQFQSDLLFNSSSTSTAIRQNLEVGRA